MIPFFDSSWEECLQEACERQGSHTDVSKIEQFVVSLCEVGNAQNYGVKKSEVLAVLLTGLEPNLDVATQFAHLQPAEVVLMIAALRGENRAVLEFERKFFSKIPALLAKMGGTADEIVEGLQHLRVTMLVGDGEQPPQAVAATLYKGKMEVLINLIASRWFMKKRQRNKMVFTEQAQLAQIIVTHTTPEASLLKVEAQQKIKEALQACISALPSKDRTLLAMTLLHGASIDDIADLFSVHRATAARWLAKLRMKMEMTIIDHLQVAAGLSSDEAHDLIDFARSRLSVSFERILT